ncbi:MAG TPA: hypothetical protein ENH72_09625 [Pseudomonas sabulinigri]|uniref:Uncharacterized protein n=1 Tax=marine sediment metagenome TaxID=412755 RepID=A0A0F9VIX7_9ZZZZ|nr:hypothetical protein [Halopseudomonas sabulinigri]HEC51751.1 hypothetical protein [Halopseudomonas sabulinigri]
MNKPDSNDLDLFVTLPEWAIGHTHGEYVMGAHLPTRDGRRCGNAHIIAAERAKWDEAKTVYICLTDAGREMRLTKNELEEMFHPTEWISDIDEVKRKFGMQADLSNIEKASQQQDPLAPGLQWATRRCEALLQQGFDRVRPELLVKDFKNCLESASKIYTSNREVRSDD